MTKENAMALGSKKIYGNAPGAATKMRSVKKSSNKLPANQVNPTKPAPSANTRLNPSSPKPDPGKVTIQPIKTPNNRKLSPESAEKLNRWRKTIYTKKG
jgi:hypothetical protein